MGAGQSRGQKRRIRIEKGQEIRVERGRTDLIRQRVQEMRGEPSPPRYSEQVSSSVNLLNKSLRDEQSVPLIQTAKARGPGVSQAQRYGRAVPKKRPVHKVKGAKSF